MAHENLLPSPSAGELGGPESDFAAVFRAHDSELLG
jgi:hypothetical protein